MFFYGNNLIIDNDNFTVTLENNTPSNVVISVPHDGLPKEDFSGLFTPRKRGWKGRDKYVWPIVNDIFTQTLSVGAPIDAVRFLMSRAFIDANREVRGEENMDPDLLGQTAFDDPGLARVYWYYHEQIDYLLSRSVCAHGKEKILFIDMHGFGKQPVFAPEGGYDLILGTANRTTIAHREVDREFAQFMIVRGYRVFLPTETPVSATGDPYSAGHITRLYGKKHAVNAMQIEISSDFRQREATSRGKKLSADMADFLTQHFASKKSK